MYDITCVQLFQEISHRENLLKAIKALSNHNNYDECMKLEALEFFKRITLMKEKKQSLNYRLSEQKTNLSIKWNDINLHWSHRPVWNYETSTKLIELSSSKIHFPTSSAITLSCSEESIFEQMENGKLPNILLHEQSFQWVF